jgi:hypothetical protein
MEKLFQRQLRRRRDRGVNVDAFNRAARQTAHATRQKLVPGRNE